jgi:hypothetical protein
MGFRPVPLSLSLSVPCLHTHAAEYSNYSIRTDILAFSLHLHLHLPPSLPPADVSPARLNAAPPRLALFPSPSQDLHQRVHTPSTTSTSTSTSTSLSPTSPRPPHYPTSPTLAHSSSRRVGAVVGPLPARSRIAFSSPSPSPLVPGLPLPRKREGANSPPLLALLLSVRGIATLIPTFPRPVLPTRKPTIQHNHSGLTLSSISSNCTSLSAANVLSWCRSLTVNMASVHHPSHQGASASANFNPSVPTSDTPYASEPSDLTHPTGTRTRPASSSTGTPSSSSAQQGQRNNRPRIPSLSIRSRGLSSSSSTSSSPVRRKPLPSTASPLATRFSSGEHLAATLELPEQTFSRPYSVDSPTLHEFPPTSRLPFAPADFPTRSFSRYILPFLFETFPKQTFWADVMVQTFKRTGCGVTVRAAFTHTRHKLQPNPQPKPCASVPNAFLRCRSGKTCQISQRVGPNVCVRISRPMV